MPTFFDYLQLHIELRHGADADAVSPPDHGIDPIGGYEHVDIVAELEALFGATWGEPWQTGEPSDFGPAEHGSPADAWLSGNEWAGEAEIGGASFTSGTVDPSGEGNSVFALDGEVLDLPG